ncbi:MAG: FAD:protein FMN transferase [Planctomycetes bacterium]|nr:FAD:protein FMN transferase [Planctomycetota bacterium]
MTPDSPIIPNSQPKLTWNRYSLVTIGCLLLVVAGLLRFWTSGRLIERNSGSRVIMGTLVRIQLRCESDQIARQAIARAFDAMEQVDQRMSTYRDDSEMSKINRLAAREPVEVSPETFNLLRKAMEYSEMTDGAFDVTVAPLIRLWRQAEKEDRLPTQEELDQVLAKIGYEKIELSYENRTVSFAHEGVEINVDAIAKGYAVDRALNAVRRPGVRAALVDIGGEIACFGQDKPGQDWIVGIQDLFAGNLENPFSQKARWRVALRDHAIATSGNYRQYVTISNKKYSHIIDPRTGMPAEKLPSVTILAPLTEDADALATAISVLGPEKGLALIDSIPDTEAFLVAGNKEKPEFYRSQQLNRYLVK